MITKLRAHITQKCKKLNIHKCGIVLGFCRSGHIYTNINKPFCKYILLCILSFTYNDCDAFKKPS